jgi:hypothetical protein
MTHRNVLIGAGIFGALTLGTWGYDAIPKPAPAANSAVRQWCSEHLGSSKGQTVPVELSARMEIGQPDSVVTHDGVRYLAYGSSTLQFLNFGGTADDSYVGGC